MARHDENHIITGNAIVVWDGITKPETTKNGQPLQKPKYSLKLALMPNDPCVAEIDAIAKAALQNSKFKGVMPHGGSWPLSPCNPQIADGVLNGMIAINPKTENGDITQKVYDASGQLLNPMTYSRMLYPGAVIQVMVHAFAFDNVQKGVALGLDGIRIVDATAPALNIGASMGAAEVGAAFGAVPVAPQGQVPGAVPPQPGSFTPPGVPQPGYGVPMQPGYGVPMQPGYGVPMQPQVGAAPMPPITPAPDFLNPPGGQPQMGGFTPPPPAPVAPVHQMTPAAGGATYESFIAQGWTDALLRQHGMMV
jgi:hypothetical protein